MPCHFLVDLSLQDDDGLRMWRVALDTENVLCVYPDLVKWYHQSEAMCPILGKVDNGLLVIAGAACDMLCKLAVHGPLTSVRPGGPCITKTN